MRLRLAWLYPNQMNIYGDRGNILALAARCRWRGIEVEVDSVGVGCRVDPDDYDLYFFGGGQDLEQARVAGDLLATKAVALVEAVRLGAVVLAICGGYQLLGHRYRPHQGADIPGLGLLDVVTVAGPTRFIGNVVVASAHGELVGFENHSGLTTLGPNCQPLGRVLVGAGNNGRDGSEGAVAGNVFGCYLHGSLLPKNPAFADLLITRALARRHPGAELAPLDDELEWAAHAAAVARARETH